MSGENREQDELLMKATLYRSLLFRGRSGSDADEIDAGSACAHALFLTVIRIAGGSGDDRMGFLFSLSLLCCGQLYAESNGPAFTVGGETALGDCCRARGKGVTSRASALCPTVLTLCPTPNLISWDLFSSVLFLFNYHHQPLSPLNHPPPRVSRPLTRPLVVCHVVLIVLSP